MKNLFQRRSSLAIAVAASLSGLSTAAMAQESDSSESADNTVEVINVTGIRSALASALAEKRYASSIKEVIQAEDIGKLPDQNLAEVLENITGVQIDRTAGVGTGVQIRGTNANRVEINGVATVGSGDGRTGISFDDLPAALISSLEVIKVPTAETVEGSVGGTINLRTLRGLSLDERVATFRVQAENSDLADSTYPRISGTFGDKWSTDAGDIGVVFTASYAEQDVASFDPRYDRDREVLPDSGRASAEDFPFFRTQFFDQVITRYEYETKNYTASFEYAPTNDVKVYFDATINDQQRAQKTSRALFSGTGANSVVDNTINEEFETINLGTIDGPNGPLVLGEVQAVLSGIIRATEGSDPNLRVSGITGSRVTDSRVFALGSEWALDNLMLSAEVSYADSDSVFPSMNTTLDFINPNAMQPEELGSLDNAVPMVFDASGGTLQFAIAEGLPESPSTADMLNPQNYALRQVARGLNNRKNDETAFRFDAAYDVADLNPFFVEVKAGLRWNESSTEFNDVDASYNYTSTANHANRPRASLFSDIITAGPDNFNAADNRTLYVRDYLMVNNDLAFSNPAAVIDALNSALVTAGLDAMDEPSVNVSSFSDISEETLAMYLQGDFSFDIGDIPINGNVGVRYIDTEVTSIGNNAQDNVVLERIVDTSDYDFVLPRFNISAEVTDDLLIRGGIAKDIRRPDFNDMSVSINYPGGAGAAVVRGNPQLKPEQVLSFDISAEYYLSEASFFSIGLFHKIREDIFATVRDNPAEPIGESGQIERDITAPCEEGGIFNPTITDRNVWSSVTEGAGICVPLESIFNVENEETQTGVEIAFQQDLSAWEDSLGWASGFGIIANYTYQEAGSKIDSYNDGSGDGNALNKILGRTDTDMSTPTLDDDVVMERIELLDLSQDSYNITLFYDKYDLSVRARYTWRSSFKTDDKISFDLNRIVDDRAQLNMSVSYDINDMFTVGLEGVNLLRGDRNQWCVNEGALFCSQGLTDRRVMLGVTARL
ncbi:TonB-dependent receptor [Alteromonas aestuariivivens]|uniref:TonB-dependent receptor n=1 Tax=Alteromonas aestuariivivens TaxID=1938339 RepID=A0A3D8MG03_9ALTE|nr:TonB-dependent receptor [Alteromonas aestuariivivens]RDV29148.1 TonB-dependent receptor [Alteromonas aestuariivivens]